MSHEFNPNPWRRNSRYVDKTYPSGFAEARPILTPRSHCAADEPNESPDAWQEPIKGGTGGCIKRFNFALRAGHGYRSAGDE
jgi:hypothetical protein